MQIYPCKVAFLAAYLALARTFGVILRTMPHQLTAFITLTFFDIFRVIRLQNNV